MAIRMHPDQGVIVTCDFSSGFKEPEMVKCRPAVIVSKPIKSRPYLCTVVALSTTPPEKVMPYHCEIKIDMDMPRKWATQTAWVKGDMLNTVGFDRLDLLRLGKNKGGKRIYQLTPLPPATLLQIQRCVLHSLGLSTLTKSLS